MSHITIAISSRSFTLLFERLRQNFHFASSDTEDFGPFSASYNVDATLSSGSLILNDDNTVELKDMRIVWNTLKVNVCFNMPAYETPDFCIVPNPWNGCLVGIPSIHIGGPTCAEIDLSGLVSKISDIRANLETYYFVNPARSTTESDIEAEFANHPNSWRIFVFIDPDTFDIELIDITDSVVSLFEQAVKKAIENLIPQWVPNWGKDLIWKFIGPVLDFFKSILGITGDIKDWLSRLLNGLNGNDIFHKLWRALKNHIVYNFGKDNPIKIFEDPLLVMDEGHYHNPIPVKIPIRDLTVSVNSTEAIIQANIGA